MSIYIDVSISIRVPGSDYELFEIWEGRLIRSIAHSLRTLPAGKLGRIKAMDFQVNPTTKAGDLTLLIMLEGINSSGEFNSGTAIQETRILSEQVAERLRFGGVKVWINAVRECPEQTDRFDDEDYQIQPEGIYLNILISIASPNRNIDKIKAMKGIIVKGLTDAMALTQWDGSAGTIRAVRGGFNPSTKVGIFYFIVYFEEHADFSDVNITRKIEITKSLVNDVIRQSLLENTNFDIELSSISECTDPDRELYSDDGE